MEQQTRPLKQLEAAQAAATAPVLAEVVCAPFSCAAAQLGIVPFEPSLVFCCGFSQARQSSSIFVLRQALRQGISLHSPEPRLAFPPFLISSQLWEVRVVDDAAISAIALINSLPFHSVISSSSSLFPFLSLSFLSLRRRVPSPRRTAHIHHT